MLPCPLVESGKEERGDWGEAAANYFREAPVCHPLVVVVGHGEAGEVVRRVS